VLDTSSGNSMSSTSDSPGTPGRNAATDSCVSTLCLSHQLFTVVSAQFGLVTYTHHLLSSATCHAYARPFGAGKSPQLMTLQMNRTILYVHATSAPAMVATINCCRF